MPAIRVAGAAAAGVAARVTLASMAYEAAFSLLGALLVSTLLVSEASELTAIAAGVAAAVLLFVAVHPSVFARLANAALRRMGRDELPTVLGARTLTPFALAYAGSFALVGLGVYATTQALHPVDSSVLPVAVASFSVGFLISLAAFFVPGGLGVREAGLAGVLSLSIPFDLALAVSVAVRLVQIGLELVLAGVTTLLARRASAEPASRLKRASAAAPGQRRERRQRDQPRPQRRDVEQAPEDPPRAEELRAAVRALEVVDLDLDAARVELAEPAHELDADRAAVLLEPQPADVIRAHQPEVAVDVADRDPEQEPHRGGVDGSDDAPVERIGAVALVALDPVDLVGDVLGQPDELLGVVLAVAVGVEDPLAASLRQRRAQRAAVAAVGVVLDHPQARLARARLTQPLERTRRSSRRPRRRSRPRCPARRAPRRRARPGRRSSRRRCNTADRPRSTSPRSGQGRANALHLLVGQLRVAGKADAFGGPRLGS